MAKAQVEEEDIIQSVGLSRGLELMDLIGFSVLERSSGIPKQAN